MKEAQYKMSSADAVMICEGVDEPVDEAQFYEAWQTLIDNDIVWQLQGWYGRAAKHFIEIGVCTAYEDLYSPSGGDDVPIQ